MPVKEGSRALAGVSSSSSDRYPLILLVIRSNRIVLQEHFLALYIAALRSRGLYAMLLHSRRVASWSLPLGHQHSFRIASSLHSNQSEDYQPQVFRSLRAKLPESISTPSRFLEAPIEVTQGLKYHLREVALHLETSTILLFFGIGSATIIFTVLLFSTVCFPGFVLLLFTPSVPHEFSVPQYHIHRPSSSVPVFVAYFKSSLFTHRQPFLSTTYGLMIS